MYRFVSEAGVSRLPEAILLLLVASLMTGRVKIFPTAKVWVGAAIAISIAGLISGTNSDMTASARTAIGLALLLGIAPFVVQHYILSSERFLRTAAYAFMSVQAVSALAGLGQAAGLSILGATANSGRANGLAGHPNVLGLMCVLALIITVVSYRAASPRKRSVLILIGTVNAVALIATGSLSSLLSLVAAVITIVAVRRASLRAAYTSFTLMIVIALLVLTAGFDPSVLLQPVTHRIDVVTGETDGVASLGIRQQTYAFAWEYIRTDPVIGVGMDSTNQGTFNGITVVHNYILHAWYQGGIAMVLAVFALTILMVFQIGKAVRAGERAAEAAFIAAILVYALGSAFYDQQQYWLPLIVSAVSCSRLLSRKPFKRSIRHSMNPPRRVRATTL